MKRKFFALSALILGLVSCQNDFTETGSMAGSEVDFSLSVGATELTRAGENGEADSQQGKDSAFGAIDYFQGADWSKVDLRYSMEVYDADADFSNGTATPVKDRMVKIVKEYEPVQFDLRLIAGREYRFVVFADFVEEGKGSEVVDDSQSDMGKHHTIGATLQDITVKNDALNAECSDAYFAKKDITISNSAAQNIVLQRPYGKIRVIATDLAELNLNVDPAKVSVKYYAKHPVAFNAVTGAVDMNVAEEALTFESEYNDIYKDVEKGGLQNHFYTAGYDNYDLFGTENANGVKRHTHMTLFTDYILAEDQQGSISFDMEVFDGNNALIKKTEFSTDIPVQRNHLTTIIGNVLTTSTNINVTINDNFDNEYVIEYVGVASAEELQEAIDKAVEGEENIINIEADIKGNVMIPEIKETTIVINGNGYKYDGCMQIKGQSKYENATTVFRNINFETADASAFAGTSFIYCNEQNGYTRYPDNVTVENCTFTATGAADNLAVGVKLRSLNGNLVVEKTSANSMHSLVQLSSCGEANVTVDNVTIEKSKNGISLGATTTAVIKNSTIETLEYGVRADGCTANTTIENSTISAKQPVIVRKVANSNNYVLNFATTVLNTATTGDYQVIFTTGSDDTAYVAPAEDAYTLNCNDATYRVFPESATPTINISNDEELLAWAWLVNNAGDVTYNANITADIELQPYVIAEDAANKTYVYTSEAITVTDGIPSGNNWPVISDYETSYNDAINVREYYGGKVAGNNYTISGLRINHELTASGFLCWTKGAVVENLTFNNAVVYNKGGNTSETYTGIIIGRCWDGSYINNCHITNSSVTGKKEVGGIAGRLYHRTEKANGEVLNEKMAYIIYCSTDENTTVKGEGNVGGIVGMNYGCIVGNCVNNADVTGINQVGGIAGAHQSYYKKADAYILGCRTTDKATITATNGSAGGFAGYTRRDNPSHTNTRVWIVGCTCESEVIGKEVGTMIGYSVKNHGTYGACIAACYAVTDNTKFFGKGSSPQIIAAYNYTDATEATQAEIDAMNAAIEEFNVSPDNIYVNGEKGATMNKRWKLVNGVPVLE